MGFALLAVFSSCSLQIFIGNLTIVYVVPISLEEGVQEGFVTVRYKFNRVVSPLSPVSSQTVLLHR